MKFVTLLGCLAASATWAQDAGETVEQPDASVPLADPRIECSKRSGAWKDDGRFSGCTVSGKRDGLWTEYGPGGQVLDVTTYSGGKKEGPSVSYFLNCQVRARGEWKNNLRQGLWSEWAITGKRVSKGTYDRGVRTGKWATYHAQSGELHLEGPYVSGQANGLFQEHLLTGEAWREVEFKGGERVSEAITFCRKQKGRWLMEFVEPAEGCMVDGARVGEWKTYDGHGKLRTIRHYVGGRLSGLYDDYHPTGELMRRGQYVEGLPEGKHDFYAPDGGMYGSSRITSGTGDWRTWHPSGRMALQGRYERGCPEGRWRVWDEEGQIVVEDNYANCVRNGLYTDYQEGGIPRRSGNFVEGLEEGPWTQRWRNGKLEWQGMYKKGERVGEWRLYRWDGSLYRVGAFLGEEPSGEWVHYFPNGKEEARGQLNEGKQEGPWNFNWATGEKWREAHFAFGAETIEPAKRCTEVMGQWVANAEKGSLGCQVCRAKPDDSVEWIGHGVWSFWHSDGSLEKRGELRAGKPTGHWEYFHDNGTVMLEGDFDGGIEAGEWRGFYRSGQLRFAGAYSNGKPAGEWRSFTPDGGVLSVGRYVEGQKRGRWSYPGGKPDSVDYVSDAGRD